MMNITFAMHRSTEVKGTQVSEMALDPKMYKGCRSNCPASRRIAPISFMSGILKRMQVPGKKASGPLDHPPVISVKKKEGRKLIFLAFLRFRDRVDGRDEFFQF